MEEFSFSFLLTVAQTVIEKKSRGADRQRNDEDQNRAPVVFRSQRIAADGGGDDGGQPPQRTDQQPHGKADVGQSGKIAQQIFGRAGQHKDDQEQQITLGRCLQKANGAQLFRREENLPQPLTKPPHQQKNAHAAQRRGY